ncbi:MAG: hypothetical protein S4CHLAM102_00630 [Chlamydiia bacterium]|nr:hypothetical protein [Chlamydiia bacterium]
MSGMKLSRRYALSLIEVLITLALAGILLSFLFSVFSKSSIAQTQLAIARDEVLEKQNIQKRLTSLFAKITEGQGAFAVEQEENGSCKLNVVFDQPIDASPEFTGANQALLSVNAEGELVLEVQPLSGKEQGRKEVLMTDVKRLRLEIIYLSPKKVIDTNSPLPPSLIASLNTPESLICHVEKEEVTHSFAFFPPTPNSEGYRYYQQEEDKE